MTTHTLERVPIYLTEEEQEEFDRLSRAIRRYVMARLRAGKLPATVMPFNRRLLLRDLLPRLEAFRRRSSR